MRPKSTALSFIAPIFIVILAIYISSCSDKKNPVTTPDTITGPKLIVSIDSTLDMSGEIKINSITSATLFDTSGAAIKTAQVSNGQASFGLRDLNPGNYFMTVNGLSQDRMPLRIVMLMDSTANIYQMVNRTLNLSLIIVDSDTLFRIKTFYGDQGGHPVRQFSDGANISPEEYAYAIESFGMMNGNIEIRVDSTATLLYLIGPPRHGENPHPLPFPLWMLGKPNHGTGLVGDPDSTRVHCQHCHPNFDVKPPNYDQLSPMNGLCYGCHYGIGGPSEGIIDPAR